MLMPGRNFAGSDKYRFGFNGKENVDEVHSVPGSFQDYGFRDYDTRIARFISVDPLTWKYPELTPYQFASNRPIDGVDLDGLEYATFNIVVLNGVVMDISVTTDYELKNAGTEGPGIQYNYIHLDEVGNAKGVQSKSDFVENRYGIYGGEYNPKLPSKGGDFRETHYDYSLEPIDSYDKVYKTHDQDFDKLKDDKGNSLKGKSGSENPLSTPANKKLLHSLDEIKIKSDNKEKDPLTNKKYSIYGKIFAKGAQYFFKKIETKKEDNVKK